MIAKYVEIRDRNTCIPAVAMRMAPTGRISRYLLGMVGFCDPMGKPVGGIVLMRLNDQKATSDPYEWPVLRADSRTMPTAHHWIEQNFDSMVDSQVVDVRFILGETDKPVQSDFFSILRSRGFDDV